MLSMQQNLNFKSSRRFIIGASLSSLPIIGLMPASLAQAGSSAKQKLKAIINGPWRNPANKARDQYRHPNESLLFWGLKPGSTIVEISPGAQGWWVEILAPFAHQTGGAYFATMPVTDAPNQTEASKAQALNVRAGFEEEIKDKSIYGKASSFEFGASKLDAFPENKADFLLVARAFHSWALQDGATIRNLKAFHRMLKPGGIFAVEQHRASEGSDPKAGNGYVPESYVISMAESCGFKLIGRSEINSNPKDTRDHPFGVWTLPPIRRSSQKDKPDLTPEQRAHFDAIGESDRMTLRFKKL
jgi:predicted methyltransferase